MIPWKGKEELRKFLWADLSWKFLVPGTPKDFSLGESKKLGKEENKDQEKLMAMEGIRKNLQEGAGEYPET